MVPTGTNLSVNQITCLYQHIWRTKLAKIRKIPKISKKNVKINLMIPFRRSATLSFELTIA